MHKRTRRAIFRIAAAIAIARLATLWFTAVDTRSAQNAYEARPIKLSFTTPICWLVNKFQSKNSLVSTPFSPAPTTLPTPRTSPTRPDTVIERDTDMDWESYILQN